MLTSPKSWLKLLSLIIAFITLLFFSTAGGRSVVDPDQTKSVAVILAVCFIWLSIGALLSSISSPERSKKNSEIFWGIFLGWGILWLAWYLPFWFPKLKLNEYGFQFDLQGSSATFWMAVAFILGFYRSLTLKIPVSVWNQIKKSLGIKEDADLKGNAKYRFLSYWNGLKSILGDILHLASNP